MSTTELEPAPRRLGAAEAPMSFAQERLWLVDQAAPGSAVYHVPLLTRWHEPVDPDALAAALTAVVARHEVLRTTYHLRGERPVQVVGAPAPVAVEVLDAGDSVDAEITARARLPFDLAAGPPLRCTVWRGVPGGDVMLLVVHHIAVDGWSLAPLYADLAEAYLAGALPELPLQYTDFASWDRASFDETRQRLLVARAAELLDTEPLTLSGVRPARPGARLDTDRPGAQVSFALPPGVDELARALRVTPFVVLHAAFQAVLHHWSGREQFVVGAVTANRPHPDVEGLIGFFVNTVPMRCSVSPEWTFRELCRRTRAEAYAALTHQWIPFDRLTAELAAAGGNHRPVDVCFALQNMPAPHPESRWTPPVVLPTGTAKFDLLLVVEGSTGTLEYATDRYPDEVARGVVDDYSDLLTRVTADPDLAPHQLFRAAPHAERRPDPALAPAATAPDADVRQAVEVFADAFATLQGHRAEITASSNFFALGGHSLLAVTMLARAGQRHGISLSPRDFFADPTVAGLARLLATAGRAGEPDHLAPPERHPATSTQSRFWFIDRLPTLRTAYLMPTVLELTGPVDRDTLRAAVDRTLARHPALRSRFELDRKQRTVFYRTDGPPATCTVTDAATWDSTTLREHLTGRCWAGFDLAADAPVRAEIVALAGRTLLVLVLHHIVADGWSRTLLLNEIAGAEPASASHPGRLERDPVAGQTEELVAHLLGAPVDITLPHDRERPQIQTTLAAGTSLVLDPDLTARLRAIAAEHECTTFLLTGALLATTLARTGPQRDFLFAFPWAGRDAPGSLDAVAMLVNTLVLRVDLHGAHTWRELLARTRNSGAIAYRCAEASFDEVVATLHPDRDLTHPPLTPVFLSAADGPDAPPAFAADVRARHLPLDPLHVKYEIELTATDHPDRLELGFAYATGLFDAGTVTALATDLHATAVALATNPDAHPLTQPRETARI